MKQAFIAIAAITCIFAGCVKDRKQSAIVVPPIKGDTVLYYWSFNNGDSSQHSPDEAVNSGAGFSYYSSYIDYTDGALVNLRSGYDSGFCLRVRNPSDSIIFRMPTTGYDSVTLSYAIRNSGSSGATENAIFYTVDGSNYIADAIGNNKYPVTDTVFFQKLFTLSSDARINDNPKFAVKIVFTANNTGAKGNNRFDNVTLKGKKK
ncbi:MAG: hypothetical protein EBZ77_01740 [Chitinophagia bacterium]|nr:hypothetical protein [Chitinophagia bacterium]